MKLLLFMIVVLAAVFATNCHGFHNGPMSEAQIFPDGTVNTDYTDEDQIIPIQQFYNNSTDETNWINQYNDEEDQQQNQIGDMSMLLGRSRWCKRRGGRCRHRKFACGDGYQASSFGRPYCTSRKRRCCFPVTTTAAPATTTPVTTTAAPATTTPGLTCSGNLSAGSDCFAIFQQDHTWNDSRNLCKSHGLDLDQPRNSTVVSKYLEDNFSKGGDLFLWLGARGNGTHMVWLSGDVVTADEPWSSESQLTQVATDSCLTMVASSGRYASGRGVLVASNGSCRRLLQMAALCG